MLRIIILMAISILKIRASDFKFAITKDLQTASELEGEKWTYVDITDLSEDDNLRVKLSFPLSIFYPDASIFFANDSKQVLQIRLVNNTLSGIFYAMPHKIEKKMIGDNPTVVLTDKFQQISGTFPRSWLPGNFSRISASVTDVLGNVYNYYWLKNFAISILDLLVIEEYKDYFSSMQN